VKLLLATPGVKSDSRDYFGRTLLWWAAAGGQEAIVKLLLMKYHSDPGLADNFSRTPLSIAARKGQHAVVKLLLEKHEENDIAIPNENMNMASALNADDQNNIICDICTLEIPAVDLDYHCGVCGNGDWDICQECIASGAFCMEDTHKLVRRVMRDGVWAKVPG
ncbi:hypothetical protein K469DRAFT_613016, partial [Zopfia rhizophila CBS 207.26]